MKTVLDLPHEEAKSFFLQKESYCNIELPTYFDFQPLLNNLSKHIKCKKLNELKNTPPNLLEGVNYKFYSNKDGCFSWRPLQLINPVVYVCLVNQITEETAWKDIVKRFAMFQKNEAIKCCSMPIVDDTDKQSTKENTIINWWSEIEQKSLEYALDYDCVLFTDIVDCYSSIYTHSIPWALHGKKEVKANLTVGNNKSKNKSNGDKIDDLIRAMAYGQTNGIPQGSVLMDFIAEIVLGYADLELSDRIEKYNACFVSNKIDNYKILRYRDDYRIFAGNQECAVKIAKILSEVLQELNFKINTQKTFVSTNIIRDSIKPDKLYWNESKQEEKSLQKQLLLIHSLAEKYPNSGSLVRALDAFYDKIFPLTVFKSYDIKVLVSILTDIAYKNPRTYQLFSAILAKFFSVEIDDLLKGKIYVSINRKFSKTPNIGHLQVWLQRTTLKDKPDGVYEDKLCKLVADNATIDEIWNISWLNQDVKNIFYDTPIVDKDIIEKMSSVPEPKEIKIFRY